MGLNKFCMVVESFKKLVNAFKYIGSAKNAVMISEVTHDDNRNFSLFLSVL